jgi:polyphosphate kinase
MTTKKAKDKKGSKSGRQGALRILSDNAGIQADANRFYNRELSWLEFNDRILSEARDTKNPLLERAKFLSITASNLDEFYIVRVASLRDMVSVDYMEKDISGLTPAEQLRQISEKIRHSMVLQYSTYTRSLIPTLWTQGICIMDYSELDDKGKEKADQYFRTTLYPILTPMGVDASRPFPLIYNRQLNVCVLIDDEKGDASQQENNVKEDPNEFRFVTLQVPNVVPRLFRIQLPEGVGFVPVEQIIRANLQVLFTGLTVIASGFYRIMRNSDLDIDEDEAEDLLKVIEERVRMRRWGEIIRLEVDEHLDERLLKILTESLLIGEEDIFPVNGSLDLTFLMKLYHIVAPDYPALCYAPYKIQPPSMLDEGSIFEQIQAKDRLVHHPYELFDPVEEFIRDAARDPQVLAIKQTLYRVGSDSPIIGYLAEAAQNGKQVLVLVELKARFDEENNINWAKMLEKAGCHVIYGLVGLKTHSKITLVVRSEEDGIRRYLHLGTGNYNEVTATIYTDIGLFTCSEAFCVDASEFFNMLSGYSEPPEWKRLIPAPLWMRSYLERKIQKEIRNAKEGKKASIIAKMNSLVDGAIIQLLYEASRAGVKIDLIVRGICCLRPGVEGMSDNITVRSITGRYLEHSRIFYFYNEGYEEIYLSSADWMPRNLDRRIELLFPVEDPDCRKRVLEILQIELDDTVRSHWLPSDGTYHKLDLRGKVKLDSQIELCHKAVQANAKKEQQKDLRMFIPSESTGESHS